MARFNLLALTGAILSTLSIAFLWVEGVVISGFGSGQTDLMTTLNDYTAKVSALFVLGAILALATQLGILFELPGLLFLPFFIWYRGNPMVWVIGYLLALLGAILIVLSFFVQVTAPGGGVRIPPESRIRVWFPWKEERNPRRIPKLIGRATAAIIVVVAVVAGIVVADAYQRPLSKIDLQVYIGTNTYVAVNLTITLDGETLATAHVDTEYFSLEHNVTAGTHHIVVDATSETYPRANGEIEFSSAQRVLPFTTQVVFVGIGVGMM